MPWNQSAVPHHDMDVWYHRIWKNAEQYAKQAHEAQGLAVTSNQLGRATTAEVHWTNAQVAPVKPNRRGDVQSMLDISTLQHSRWTKQVRRLQHLSRCLGATPAQPSLVEHRANLWHKIRTAPGFPGGFACGGRPRPSNSLIHRMLSPCRSQNLSQPWLFLLSSLPTTASWRKTCQAQNLIMPSQDPSRGEPRTASG